MSPLLREEEGGICFARKKPAPIAPRIPLSLARRGCGGSVNPCVAKKGLRHADCPTCGPDEGKLVGSDLRDATAVDPPVMPEVYSLTIPNLAAESRKHKALTRRWNGHLPPQPRLV